MCHVKTMSRFVYEVTYSKVSHLNVKCGATSVMHSIAVLKTIPFVLPRYTIRSSHLHRHKGHQYVFTTKSTMSSV